MSEKMDIVISADKLPSISLISTTLLGGHPIGNGGNGGNGGNETPIVERMRALFWARNINSAEATEVLIQSLSPPNLNHSVLYRHEVAYVLGQMSHPDLAIPCLVKLLDDQNEHPMVRHEAGEALAALKKPTTEALEAVRRGLEDESLPVRETCILALEGLRRVQIKETQNHLEMETSSVKTSSVKIETETETSSVMKAVPNFYVFTSTGIRDAERLKGRTEHLEFGSVDPVNGIQAEQSQEAVEIETARLISTSNTLWDRYEAMFNLRNMKTEKSAKGLCDALVVDSSSALLRHEICFVLGQLQFAVSGDVLCEMVKRTDEASMVRHEAALSLGSVGADKWSVEGKRVRNMCLDVLEKFKNDADPIVAESCVCALDNILIETGDLEKSA